MPKQFTAGEVIDPAYLQRWNNFIIGGDFGTNPWQRGTSFAGLGAVEQYTADRFKWVNTSAAVVTVAKTANSAAVDPSGVHSSHCLHVDCTTADATVAAGDVALLRYRAEGFDVAALGFGVSGTRYLTVAFSVTATKTGTYCVALTNSAGNRSYVKEFTVNASNTRERKVLTFPVDTSGTWLYDAGIGLTISFVLMAGTTYQTSADAWAAGNYVATSNQVNGLDSTSNDFKLDLVAAYFGDVSMPWVPVPAAEVLRQCRRYYRQWNFAAGGFPVATGYCTASTAWFVSGLCADNTSDMRATPTINMGSASNYLVYDSAGSAVAVTSFNAPGNAGASGVIYASGYVASGLTAGAATTLGSSVANAATVSADAEL
jgi:hypothetical protein